MTFEDKINDVIGKPYDAYSAHCWDLVCYLIPDAPKPDGTAKTLTASIKHFKEELKHHNLKEIDENYKNKDIIILGKNNIFFHAGVYYDGGVVHASLDGVVYQTMDFIHRMYGNIQGLRV